MTATARASETRDFAMLVFSSKISATSLFVDHIKFVKELSTQSTSLVHLKVNTLNTTLCLTSHSFLSSLIKQTCYITKVLHSF